MPQAPVFQKEKGETNKAFMNRVNMETKEVIKESQLEKKYRVGIVISEKNRLLIIIDGKAFALLFEL